MWGNVYHHIYFRRQRLFLFAEQQEVAKGSDYTPGELLAPGTRTLIVSMVRSTWGGRHRGVMHHAAMASSRAAGLRPPMLPSHHHQASHHHVVVLPAIPVFSTCRPVPLQCVCILDSRSVDAHSRRAFWMNEHYPGLRADKRRRLGIDGESP